MELWKKLLITLFTIGAIIAIVVIIFAISAKCKADDSTSGICKFANGVTNFVDDVIKAIKYAIWVAIGGVLLSIFAALARWGYGLWKGAGDPEQPADPKNSETSQQQKDDEDGNNDTIDNNDDDGGE